MNERLAAANAAAGWEPFSPDEQRQIDSDATKSADILFYDLPRPPQVNAKIRRALALELIEKHIDKGQYRKVIQSLGNYHDMLAFQRGYRKQTTSDRQYVIDHPWEAGTKFLILYSGNPAVVVPVDNLNEWPYVTELFMSYCTRKPMVVCDARISTRCKRPTRFQVIHYKVGQFLCFHRVCPNCVEYLMSGDSPANGKRLMQLLRFVEMPDSPTELKLC